MKKPRTTKPPTVKPPRTPPDLPTTDAPPQHDFEVSRLSDETPLGVDMEAVRRELAGNARVFEAIGRFIFQFSQLEFTMKAFLAAQIGLADKHFDAVTAPYDFRMLCAVTQAISLMRFPEQKKAIESLFSRCLSLNDD